MADEPTPSDGPTLLALAEVRDLIAAAIDEALAPLEQQIAELQAQVAERVRYGDWVAVQASGQPDQGQDGLYLSADHGGPTLDGEPCALDGRSAVGAWESWRLARGVW